MFKNESALSKAKSNINVLFSWRGFLLLAGVKVAVHLPVLTDYNFHGDELYFLEGGLHLDWGYADHPPLVVWLSRLSFELFGYSLFGLRLWPLSAGILLIGLTMRITQRLGGGGLAQTLAGLCIVLAPAYLRMATLMNIPAFEQVVWSLGVLMILRLMHEDDRRQLLYIGVLVGFGLLLKFTFLLLAASLVGVLLVGGRKYFTDYRLWLGGLIALIIWSPNLIWQIEHDYAHLQFLSNISRSDGMLGRVPRILFVVGQLLYFGPYLAPVWIGGLIALLRQPDPAHRALAMLYIVPFLLLLITNAKPYYLGPAYPLLFAAGTIVGLDLIKTLWLRIASLGFVIAAGVFFMAVTLPWLPLKQMDRTVDTILMGIIPARGVTHDYHNQMSWQNYHSGLLKIYNNLPEQIRQDVFIWTAYYRQASALRMTSRLGPSAVSQSVHLLFQLNKPPTLSVDAGEPKSKQASILPEAYSTHQSYYFWPPDFQKYRAALVLEIPADVLKEVFAEVTLQGRLPEPVHLVAKPKGGWSGAWARLKHFSNSDYNRQNLASHPDESL